MLKRTLTALLCMAMFIQIPILSVYADDGVSSAANNDPPTVTLPANTPLSLVMLEELYSQRNREGDEIVFALTEDVVIMGKTYLVAGTPVLGRVVGSKAAKSWGRKGTLDIEIFTLAPLYSGAIPLTGDAGEAGGDTTVAAVATTVLLGISVIGLLAGGAWGGKGAVIPAGTTITVFTAQDGQVMDIPAEEMRAQIDDWFSKKVITSFISYSPDKKCSISAAFLSLGHPIDQSMITVEKGEDYQYKVTVTLDTGNDAIFIFQPFQEPHIGKFATMTAENDFAIQVLKLVK